MTNYKIRSILQGNVKYREGKKWKKRYCLLALSPGANDAMHIYMAKSYDDFNPYRTNRCLVDVEHSIQQGDIAEISPHSPEDFVHSRDTEGQKSIVNTAAQSCLLAVEATAKGLSAATNLATRLNAPVPVDEISGFESGCHLDKESSVVVLIGINSVHIIALESVDRMFSWASAMGKILTDNLFRVTLRKSSEGSKLPQGIQGSLHFQHWRLCLIGEPLAGCKFICSWKLDSIEKAYTIVHPATSTVPSKTSTTDLPSAHGHRWSFGVDISNRMSAGNIPGLSSSGTGQLQVSKPRHCLILEASSSAGKGRGIHTFELEGGSLAELTATLERFMDRRFNPNSGVNRKIDAFRPSATSLNDSVDFTTGNTFAPCDCNQQPQFSSSPDACGSLHSVSPAQSFATQQYSKTNYQTNPFKTSTTFSDRNRFDGNVYGRATQTLPSNRFTNPSALYSNLIPCKPSLSPPELMAGSEKLTDCNDARTSETNLFGCSQPTLSPCRIPTETSAESGIPFENSASFSDPSQAYNFNSADSKTSSLSGAATLPPSWNTRSGSRFSRKSNPSGLRPTLPGFFEAVDEVQVARVPAGLVIPKILASPSTPNATRMKNPVVSSQPPILSSKVLLQNSEHPSRRTSVIRPEPFPASEIAPSICSLTSELDSQSVSVSCSLANKNVDHEDCQLASEDRTRQHASESQHTCCFPQQGVFTADEDLWDTDHGDPHHPDLAETLSTRHPICSRHPSSKQTSVFPSKPVPSKNVVSGCLFCRKMDMLNTVAYQVYRTRYQQYKTCWCHRYIGRSFSADTLTVLDFLVPEKPVRSTPAHQGSLPSNSSPDRPATENRESFDAAGPQPKYSGGSVSRHSMPKGCGIRWKHIHRFFNRKQSQSHDNIDECHCPGKMDLNLRAAFHSSMVDTNFISDVCSGDLDCRPHRIGALQEYTRCSSLKQPLWLSIRCPRHGFIFYPPLIQYLLNSPLHLPLCSRCRKRKHRERGAQQPAFTKSLKNETATWASTDRFGITFPSVTSAFRVFSYLRQKSVEAKTSINKSALSRKSATVCKEAQSRAAFTPSVPEEPSAHPSQLHVETNLPRDSVRPPPWKNLGLCDYHSQHPRRTNSHLSLTSLPCSEPAIPRCGATFDRIWELGARSPFSSVSSLLTFRSLSGSSSLISACYGSAHGKKAIAGSLSPQIFDGSLRDTRDPSEEKVNCSLCDVDDLSSGSVSACCEDPNFLHERRSSDHNQPAVSGKNVDIPYCPAHTQTRRSEVRNSRTEDGIGSGVENVVSHGSANHPWFQENHPSNYCLCFAPTGRHPPSTKRANTLPNTKLYPSDPTGKSTDSAAPSHLIDSVPNSKPRPLRDSKTNVYIDRLLPRFTRRGRCHARYNTANVVTTSAGPQRLARKLSSQSNLEVACHSLEDVDRTDLSTQPIVEPTSYCNVTPVQHSATNFRLDTSTHHSTKIQKPRSHQTKNMDTTLFPNPNSNRNTNPNMYVNVSPNVVDATVSRSGRSVQQLLQSMQPLVNVQKKKTNPSLFVNDSVLHSSSLPNKSICTDPNPCRPSCAHTSHSQGFAYGQSRFQDSDFPLHLSSSMETSELPAEVRDPSRNYAMVDLRPSPASSTHAHTELTVNAVQQSKLPTLRFGEVTSTASSTGSTIGFSNSASTGSDCTSDAATLISDSAEKGSPLPGAAVDVCSTHNTCALFGSDLTTPKEPSRRRHSHSLSSVTSVAPVLNYVDVIASTAPFVHQEPHRRADPSTLSDPSGSSIPEHTDSFSSSSGLGGIASQSITPPLAPGGSASFGDIFTSRSMTSSATSSGEGVTADQGFHSCSPPDSSCVAYTQIDITRTMALEELSGDIEHENLHAASARAGNTAQSHSWCPSKIDRSTSVRKTLSRPIRSMRRGTQKKTGGFFS